MKPHSLNHLLRLLSPGLCLRVLGLPVFGLPVFGLLLLGNCWGEVPPSDTLELSLGCHMTGQLIKKQNNWVFMQVDDELAVAIPQQRVRRLREDAELTAYKHEAASANDDPEKHYQVARWCVANKLSHQYRYHLHRVIALEPDHAKARMALGYVKQTGGSWILYSQQQRGKGLVPTKAGWDFPEAVARRKMRDEANVKANQYRKELARLMKTYLKAKSDRAPGVLAAIQGMTDPLAAGAAADQLERSRGTNTPRNLRKELVTLLGTHRTTTSVRSLVKTALEETDAAIREAAITELKKYGSGSAVATCLPMLKSNSRTNVDRALRVLQHFVNRAHVMAYVDALITSHKTEIAPNGRTSAGFGSDGGSSFSTGGKKKVIVENVKHPIAIAMLKEAEPGVDFGYNAQAWREHFSAQLNYYSGNLRRDP